MCRLMRIEHRHSTVYYPQANGKAERLVRTVKELIKKIVRGDWSNWHRMLPAVQYQINHKRMAVHNSVPFELMFGRKRNEHCDYRGWNTYKEAEDQMKERLIWHGKLLSEVIWPAIYAKVREANRKRNDRVDRKRGNAVNALQVGDKVMLRNLDKEDKKDDTNEGPFEVIAITSSKQYRLKDQAGNELPDVYNRSQLHKIDEELEEEERYVVEKLHDHRTTEDGRMQYLVEWEG